MSYSAIIGDIIGSSFEMENHRNTFFELFRMDAYFTDDTVITSGIADILINLKDMPLKEEDSFYLNKNWAANKLRAWCLAYPNRGFGGLFSQWLQSGVNKPYESTGNGALLRVAPVVMFATRSGWDREKAWGVIHDLVSITHNSPQALKACEALMDLLFSILESKDRVRGAKLAISRIVSDYKYNISTLDEYRANLVFDMSAQTSFCVACSGILSSASYEEVFRNIVSVGGDSDTYCAIAGPIAEFMYGLDHKYLKEISSYFSDFDAPIFDRMDKLYHVFQKKA